MCLVPYRFRARLSNLQFRVCGSKELPLQKKKRFSVPYSGNVFPLFVVFMALDFLYT